DFTVSVKTGTNFDKIQVLLDGDKIAEKGMGDPWINEEKANLSWFVNETLFVSVKGLFPGDTTITAKVLDNGTVAEEETVDVEIYTPLDSSYKREIESLSSRVDTLSSIKDDLYTKISDIEGKVSSLKSEVDSRDYDGLESGLEEVLSGLSSLAADLSSTEQEFSEKTGLIEAKVYDLEEEITQLTSTGFFSFGAISGMNPLLSVIGVLTFVAIVWFGLFMYNNGGVSSIYGKDSFPFAFGKKEETEEKPEAGIYESDEDDEDFKGKWAFLAESEKQEQTEEKESKRFNLGDLIKSE
ncbi:MAG: hypothetical protein ACTSRU_12500, partial [Candidatus Hodarchaeales archaeon]